jgi:hypothetical protein
VEVCPADKFRDVTFCAARQRSYPFGYACQHTFRLVSRWLLRSGRKFVCSLSLLLACRDRVSKVHLSQQ